MGGQICIKANFAEICSLDLSDENKKKFTTQKNGESRFFAFSKWLHQVPGMVRLTFLLWEIIQKFVFLSWGFHILAPRKNIFVILGGPNGPLGAFSLVFGQKMPISGEICKEIKIF